MGDGAIVATLEEDADLARLARAEDPLEVGGLGRAGVIGGGEGHLDRAVGVLEDVGDVRLVRAPHLSFARDRLVVAAGGACGRAPAGPRGRPLSWVSHAGVGRAEAR